MIPQTDPKAAYHERKAEIDAAISRVLESGRYILGPEVEGFEQEFAAYAGVRHAVAVASGTDALILALRALGIGPGDAVITVSHTAVATVAAVELVGAMPVLVDVDVCHGLDPEKLAATLAAWPSGAPKPKAIIPVHLYGQPAAMNEIMAIAEQHGLAVLEDNSQAHGATLDGTMVGRFGRIAAYSLYPTKNLGAIGDGGIVATDDPELTTALKELREYGWRERYVSAIAGMNSRLDPLQAAILRVKLSPLTRPGAEPVYHQYVVEAPGRRDALQAALRERGVGTLVHYPVPVHLQPAYKGRVPLGAGGLPRTEAAALAVLSLPMFPQLADAQMEQVIAAIRDAWRQAA